MTAHSIGFRVYYEDTDAGGIVYHARYLAFAERARTEAIRAHGDSAAALASEFGLAFVVRRADMLCHRPLRLDEVAEVTTRLIALGAARCTLSQIVRRAEELCVELTVELACIRVDNGRPARFPPRWRALLESLAA
ncbi:4-hydroxybenzoyl-CoA thioesterase [Ameyamaea chiangmaiensis NBRC 103196]|uniref:YbgC/FadM family acyl-CoA thioesterase n=1 Tax=Ameyamaea chiangmaiensis TaxID=442969 RepID=A0A850PBZ2_9PROT|nr:YbgC/FadM family acyl-CoA thioesterase [Ameyamaea chiangmaiensis]MBS4074826.1 YbgC/FadM family acyl-CoA thioesterase [Ameyamaea chiangmaiensis]NVN42055.1 YbgC/FadM family acyl-CoA thioesterase [Ameyamaea chiangmaiensis]GBQ62866.1 4-hydroxybenzoyl-CoA thioesterase [Ameyamaea chiangmaiensis NBRC 103196]